MDTHHRKIDLQSPADFLYLQSNIQTAGQQKLDLAIPPQGEDAFRSKVQELVHNYISQTLNLALPSLSVNGLDAPSSLLAPENTATNQEEPPSTPPEGDTNYESYDPRLGAKLRDLYAQLEQESTRVAELRRDAPGAAARAYMERLEAEMEVERVAERERTEGQGKDDDAQVGLLLEAVKVGNLEEVESMWGKGTGGLVGLGKISTVLAKLERAATAAEVVEGI